VGARAKAGKQNIGHSTKESLSADSARRRSRRIRRSSSSSVKKRKCRKEPAKDDRTHLWAYFKLPATGFRSRQTKTTSPRTDRWTVGQLDRDGERVREKEMEKEREELW